ncbi:MAG TPA: aspartyl protease family protein [Sphingomonas sp.]|nr:aspartyl protease family protein [Sphingomonas sp.]
MPVRVRAHVLLLLLLAGFAPAPPIAPGAVAPVSRLAPDSARQWVPFTLTPGNQVRFTAMLDGKPVTAILDTGLSTSVLSRDYVRTAGLRVAQKGNATVIGGMVPIGWAATRSLSLGGLTRRGGEIAVADIPALAAGGGQSIDLLVGPDLLKGYALDIDYPAGRFRLLPSGQLPFRGASAPLGISPATNVYLTDGTLGGRRLHPLVVDTGDGSMLTVSHRAWQAAEPDPPPMTTATSYGLGGAVVTGLAIVPELRLGDLVARRIEVRVEPPGGFSEAIGVEGRIGTGLMQRYRVLLDPGAGRMVLAPGPDADQPPVRSTSGLLLGFEGDRLRVMHVMRGSPAAAQGWKDGETICTIDGRPIPRDYPDNALSGWSVGAPGRVVALGLCRGATRHLTLRNFY